MSEEIYRSLWDVQYEMESPTRNLGCWMEILLSYLERKSADPETAIYIVYEIEREIERVKQVYDKLDASTRPVREAAHPVAPWKRSA